MAAIAALPIKSGLQANYNALTRDPNTLYITSDTKRLYYGDILLSENWVVDNFVKEITFDPATYIFTITYCDDTTSTINLTLSSIVKGASYSSSTHKLTITFANNSTVDIDLTDLVDIYTVDSTNTVAMDITDGEITSNVKISATGGNTISAKADGIFADKLKPIPLDEIVIGNTTDIKSSGKKIITEIATATDVNIPTAKAVVDALQIGTF